MSFLSAQIQMKVRLGSKNPNPNGVLLMKSDGSPPVESGRLLARILQKKAISTTAQSNVVKID